METPTLTVRGIVREGLVVPLGDEELPEGARVEIRVIAAAPDKTDEDSLREALTDAERWRQWSEETGAVVDWSALD